jgi:integrase/recombinase XerD
MNTKTTTPLEEEYIEYLKYKRFMYRTIEHKLMCMRRFLEWLKREDLILSECSYADILSFLKGLRSQQFSVANQNAHIVAIRNLYECQIMAGKADRNPLMNLHVKGRIQRIPHNLLTPEQLDKIYHSYNPLTEYQQRNKVILGLYINQGLTRMEMSRLEVEDVDLAKGTIQIRNNVKLNERTLPLAAYQVPYLYEYINNIRPKLLKQSDHAKGDRLFFTYANGQTVNETIKKLLIELRKRNPELTSFNQIRGSVIYNWMKEKQIREVQYMAGHNSLTSTQRYQDVNMQDLHASLNEFHPLK